MNRKDIFVETVIFNPDLLKGGAAVRVDGCDHEGDDITGNYIVCGNTGHSLRLVGESGGMARNLTVTLQDIGEEHAELKVLAEK